MTDEARTAEERLDADELIVRGFMTAGVLTWAVAALGSALSGQPQAALGYGALALCALGVLVIGLFRENVAAMVLVIAVGAFIAWGILAAWEAGVWLMVALMVIAPAFIAALMYSFAEYEEEVIEREEHVMPTRAVHA